MVAFLAAVAGVLGLAVGSFLNVVAHRVPLGKSVLTPRSACPSCGSPIANKDNVPVVSWFLLGGRCRDCGERISGRYPLVEVVTGSAFALTPIVLGVTWVLPAYLWFVGVTIALTLTDLDHKRIPNRILYPSTVFGLVLLLGGAALESSLESFGRALVGGAGYFALLFLIALAARGGFGFGDVKLAFFLGMFMAYRAYEVLVTGVFLAFFIGGGAAIVLLIARKKSRKDAVPFGPSMVLASWVAVVWGSSIADWYLG